MPIACSSHEQRLKQHGRIQFITRHVAVVRKTCVAHKLGLGINETDVEAEQNKMDMRREWMLIRSTGWLRGQTCVLNEP